MRARTSSAVTGSPPRSSSAAAAILAAGGGLGAAHAGDLRGGLERRRRMNSRSSGTTSMPSARRSLGYGHRQFARHHEPAHAEPLRRPGAQLRLELVPAHAASDQLVEAELVGVDHPTPGAASATRPASIEEITATRRPFSSK